MANNRYRIEIPQNPTELLSLMDAIRAKHEALGAQSPLAGLKWAEVAPALNTAKEQNALSVELRRQAETATGARDAKLPLIAETVRAARDVLMGLNRENPDALGAFGFDVSDARAGDTTAPPPQR
jgi:hypothetical protein